MRRLRLARGEFLAGQTTVKTAQPFGLVTVESTLLSALASTDCTCNLHLPTRTRASTSLLGIAPAHPHLLSQPSTSNILRSPHPKHLAAFFPSYLFQNQNTQTWHIISRPKAGDQPPIASTFANPDFICPAISNNPSRILATTHHTSIVVNRADTRIFLPNIAALPILRLTHHIPHLRRPNLRGVVIIRQSGFRRIQRTQTWRKTGLVVSFPACAWEVRLPKRHYLKCCCTCALTAYLPLLPGETLTNSLQK